MQISILYVTCTMLEIDSKFTSILLIFIMGCQNKISFHVTVNVSRKSCKSCCIPFYFKSAINVCNDVRFSDFFWKCILEKLIGSVKGGGGCGSVTRAAAGDATACSCGGCRAEVRWGWTRTGPCSR